jgi:tRNA threonylcarbamoyladenosine biosynthesis protein TsaE
MNGPRLTLPDPEDTRRLGRELAALLRAGDLVVLVGRLGAGKTMFVKGIGDGLGVAGEVTSPTFVIARVHRPDPARGGRIPLVHVDAYRLGDVSEVDDLDLDAALEESVTVVEWGGGLVEHLTDAWLEVRIDRSSDSDDTRTVELVGHGGDWAQRLTTMNDVAARSG